MAKNTRTTLIRGIGTNNGKYYSWIDGKTIIEYNIWQHMLFRCTESFWVKNPTYTGTTCSENFKSYSYFYEWCQSQVGFKSRDENNRIWQLDKDLLLKRNKVYGEDTCVFLPHKINCLLTKRQNARGQYPIGISWNKRDCRFQVGCNNDTGIKKALGNYKTIEEAFQAYKTFKEAYIKQVANEYKDKLDPRAYQALLNYRVEITD